MKNKVEDIERIIKGVKPLSVNQAWRGGRRFKTKEYEDYKTELDHLIKSPILPLKGELKLEVEFGLTQKTFNRSDLDNLLKPLIDLLQDKGFFENDKQIFKITAEKLISEDYFIKFKLV